MGAALGDPAALDHHDLVGVDDGGEAVGDHDHGAAMADARQGALDGGLGLVVHGAGGLVQHQDRRVLEQRPGQREALALAAGEAHAALAHRGIEPLGQRLDEAPRLGGPGRLDHLRLVGLRLPVGDVVAHRALEQVDVLADQADGAAQRGEAHRIDRLAVDTYAPGVRVVEAQQQLDQGRLAGAGGAHQGQGMARRHLEADVLHAPSALRVTEAHAREADRAPQGLYQRRGGVVAHADRHRQQVEDAPGAGHGALEQVDHLGEPRQRPQQALGEEHQHAVGAHVELAPERQHAAHGEGGQEAGQDRHADHRDEGGADLDGAPVGLHVGLAHLAQPRRLAGLAGEALDGGDAGQVVGQPAGQVAHLLAHVGVERARLALEVEGAPDDQRDGREGEQRDQRRDDEEHRPHRHHGDPHLDQGIGAAIQEALQLVDVVVHGSDQLAGAPGLEEGHVQALGVLVGIQAHVGLEALGEVAPQDLVEVLEQRLAGPDKEGQDRQNEYLLLGRGEAEARHEARLLVDHHVDGHADQDLGGDIEQLVDDRAGAGGEDAPAVAAGVAQQAHQRLEAAGGGRGGGHGESLWLARAG